MKWKRIVTKFQKIKCWRIKECCAAALRKCKGAHFGKPMDTPEKVFNHEIQVMFNKRNLFKSFQSVKVLGETCNLHCALHCSALCILQCWRFLQFAGALEISLKYWSLQQNARDLATMQRPSVEECTNF